uniref:SHSP domain-containing protein n=1 Tax=Picea sitchensis TaxID=3332 RepID=A9NQG6_PICSI|nr:unknown [Picea sitchensis]
MATVVSAKINVMKSVIPTIKKCLLPSGRPGDSAASAMCRSLSTAAAMRIRRFRPEDDPSIQDDKQSRRASETLRRGWPNIFEDSCYPLRNLGFGLDQLFDNPFLAASRNPWDAIEDKEALHLGVDMPGLGKEDVKVYAEENALVIKGESLSEAELDGTGRKFSSRIELPAKVYKLDQIKAQMKNGVLKVTVPKFTEEEIKNVINVNIE